jgi:hypothetical protein
MMIYFRSGTWACPGAGHAVCILERSCKAGNRFLAKEGHQLARTASAWQSSTRQPSQVAGWATSRNPLRLR